MTDTKAITDLVTWKAENHLYRDWNIFTLDKDLIRVALHDRGYSVERSVTVQMLQHTELDLLALMVADCIKILKEQRP